MRSWVFVKKYDTQRAPFGADAVILPRLLVITYNTIHTYIHHLRIMKTRILFSLLGLLLTTVSWAQTVISGQVVTAGDNEPVVGATVKVKGTTRATGSDADGRFSIQAEEGAPLVISYIGMVSQEVAARQGMTVTLKEDDQQLDEIVVTGYGVTRRQAFTGSAATIGDRQIGNKVDPNPIKSLEGTVAGLQMNIGSGQPGAPASIFIRGCNSLNSGTQPLYVIDGVPFDNDVAGIRAYEGQEVSPLSTLNAADIESMTVLKDATATSIYGARAANGVIVITTKHGKSGRPKVNFSAKAGWNELPSYTDRYKIVGAAKQMELVAEALGNSYSKYGDESTFAYYNATYGLGLNADREGFNQFFDWYTEGWYSNYKNDGVDVDWIKEITRKGLVQSYGFDIAGGGATETAPKYFASFAYDNNVSYMLGKDLTRYTFRFNMDHLATPWVKYGFNTNLSYTMTNMGSGGGYFNDPMTAAYLQSQMTPVRDADGNYNMDTASGGYNPVALRSEGGDKGEGKQYRVLLSPYVQLNFTPELFFRSQGGLDLYLIDEFNYWSFLNPQGISMNGMGENSNATRRLLSITNTLNYVTTLADAHHLNLMIGQEGQTKYYKQAYLAGSNYPVRDLTDVSLTATPSVAATYQEELILSSFFFNGQYDYRDKYYLSASLRADGSSRFAKGHRWATFWSVGGKYRFTEEAFMAPLKAWLSSGALRASYGTTGNQEVGSGYYAAQNLYDFGYNYNGQPGMALQQFANEDLKWEMTRKMNVGIDLTLFDRVSLGIDWYNHQTTDMVFEVPLSYATGMSSIYQNIGRLENRGWEISLAANLLKTAHCNWTVTLTGSTNRNRVKRLSNELPIENVIQITEVGKPIYQFFMKEYAGVNPETGEPQWYLYGARDEVPAGADPQEVTTNYNKAGKRYLGSANPKFFGSLSTQLDLWGFDLGVQLNYSLGGKIYGNNLRYDAQIGSSIYQGFLNYIYDNRWQQPGDVTQVPALDTEGSFAERHSSRFLMDGRYLKLRSLTLGYTVPKAVMAKTRYVGSLRVFMEAENLYTFTSKEFIGMDPAGVDATGMQWWNTPQSRSFIFGLKLSL